MQGPQKRPLDTSLDTSPERFTRSLSKRLLCRNSPYFERMFEGNFQEAKEQSATLEPIEGVVSERSFESLIEWMYLDRIQPPTSDPRTEISTAIEFARLADMCQVKGLESVLAERIKTILVENSTKSQRTTDSDHLTHWLSPQHIASAANLPKGHRVRSVLAAASVEGYLRLENLKLYSETRDIPSFSADILEEMRSAHLSRDLKYLPDSVQFIRPYAPAVTLILSTNPERSIDSPSANPLKIHHAIARITHINGAGQSIDSFLRDMEETEEGDLNADRSSRIDDYVSGFSNEW
ncbi:hypothetical protein BO70DRAFT_353422 [Aspergillus heteromorphus CBS 117.55]|uniref:BTB domain-containing protein n=1 Tax=Aspergillus heteromorphus CBS 117.55 TaxID=1448321 RepID=A0A317W3L4_9EURO|nr:uncharacterized protein BO70DRAFT_353422 [Aspergillus heteromorphus CBS 117.55]PWY79708.1 hypothetical protein BO70DRAFT_353422 [Aspergillus heteromorphus CBS 117.55]